MTKPALLTALAALTVATPVYALVNLGEGRIDLTVTASAMYDTEIRSRNEGREDYVFTLRSALVYNRPSQRLDISASVGMLATRFLDYDEFNDEDIFFDLSISPGARMRTSRFTVSGDLNLNTETRSDPDVGDIITVRNYGASLGVVYDPNSRYTVQGSAGYDLEDPQSDFYNEVERYNAGIRLFVPIAEELDVSAGLAYEDTRSDDLSRLDNQTYTYSVGVRGAITAKLQGSLSAGMQDRQLDTGGSTTAPFLSAELTWMADESTRVGVTADRQLGTKINDRVSESFSVELNLRRQLNQEWSLSGGIGYLMDDLEGFGVATREDEEGFGYLGLNYRIVRWGNIGAELRYSDRTSTAAEFEYDRLQAGLRFSARW